MNSSPDDRPELRTWKPAPADTPCCEPHPLIETGTAAQVFGSPRDERTAAYIGGMRGSPRALFHERHLAREVPRRRVQPVEIHARRHAASAPVPAIPGNPVDSG